MQYWLCLSKNKVSLSLFQVFFYALLCFECIYLFNFRLRTRLLILERAEGREEERERNTDVREIHQSAASCRHTDQGLNPQPRHVPCPESNSRPWGFGMMLQPTAPHQPGLRLTFYSPPLVPLYVVEECAIEGSLEKSVLGSCWIKLYITMYMY